MPYTKTLEEVIDELEYILFPETYPEECRSRYQLVGSDFDNAHENYQKVMKTFAEKIRESVVEEVVKELKGKKIVLGTVNIGGKIKINTSIEYRKGYSNCLKDTIDAVTSSTKR